MSQNTLKELREEIAREREWEALHKKSIEHWKNTIHEMEDEREVIRDNEWKTRYDDQVVCNASLEKQIKQLKTEVSTLRNDVSVAEVSGNLEQKSVNECRQHIKNLKNKLLSLRGQCSSYEYQQNLDSTGYAKACEEIRSIKKDVRFKQASCNKIAKQPPINQGPKQVKSPSDHRKKSLTLPPINQGPKQVKSPSDHRKKSLTLPPINQGPKPIVKAPSAHREKNVTLPPINPNPQRKNSYLVIHEETKTKKSTKNTSQKKVHFSFDNDYIESV